MYKTGNRAFALLLVLVMAFGLMVHLEARAGSYPNTPTDGHTHVFGSYVLDLAAKCTEEGQEHHVCTLCGATEIHTIAPTGHKFGPWNMTTPASCTAAGVETRFCTVCGASETRPIAKLQHIFGDWSASTPAGCVTTGIDTRRCTLCNVEETRISPALGHNYGAWVTTLQPTCTALGTRTATCSRCSDVKSEALAMIPHTWGAWTQTKAATCSAAGERAHECSVCHTLETQAIPALGKNQANGHSFGPWIQSKAPSCTELGKEARTCSACGRVEDRDVAKLKHVPSKMWYALRKPTLTEPGIKYRVCELCGKRLDSMEYAPEGYRYGEIALNFGPYVKDLKPQELGTYADRFTPLDLSADGETQWPLITQDGYYIGMIKLTVLQDTVTITYLMNDPATVVPNELLFLRDDAMMVTGADLNDVSQALTFGEIIPLDSLTNRVLNVRLVVNYDQDNPANRSFSDQGLYLDGMTQNALLLQDMTLKLTGEENVVTP
ncbi:MAG: hypothetical protein AB9880_07515 [Christensenellales bacterium]